MHGWLKQVAAATGGEVRLAIGIGQIEMDQAIALSAGFMEASSPLTSVAGFGGLNR